MKKFAPIKLLSVFTTLVFAASAFAADWVYDYSQGRNVQWSAALGTSESAGYWYDSADPSNYIMGSYSETDSFFVGDETGTGNVTIVLDTDVTIGSLTLSGKDWNNSATITSNNYSQSLTILGDLVRAESAQMAFVDGLDVLTVGGNVILGRSNIRFRDKKVVIEGDIVGNALNGSVSNVYAMPGYGTASKTLDEGLANPDMVVGGVLRSENIALVLYSMADSSRDTYIQVGGISGNAGVRREAPGAITTVANTTSYFVFTNSQDYSTSGAMSEVNNNYWLSQHGKMALVMNGTASQEFTGNALCFQGGVKVLSGSLKMAFNQNANNYSHMRSNSRDNPNNPITVTYMTQEGGSTRTAYSHGDLEISGGEFSSSANAGYGSFRFTNIKYSGGTITLRLDGATSMDSIDLTTYYGRVSDLSSGEEVITWETYSGGTITRMEGAGKITFNFTGDLVWLVDYESEGKQGVKIVAWDALPQELTADDFTANRYSSSGDDYMAQFALYDDGLYVYYTAVPEPAELAALFGAIALGVAAWRRRRGGR